MKKYTYCILMILVFSLLSTFPLSRDAQAGLLIPDVTVEIHPGYVVLDGSLEEHPVGQVNCHFTNPSLYQVTVEARVIVPDFQVTPETFSFVMTGGQDMHVPITVSGYAGQVGRAVARVEVELKDVSGVPAAITKTRTASFIVAAPPFTRLNVNPATVTMPGTGWYQRVLTIYNTQPVGQYFDIQLTTNSPDIRAEASSSRVFFEAKEQSKYPILVWCGDEGAAAELDILFTPDYGDPRVVSLGVACNPPEEKEQGFGESGGTSGGSTDATSSGVPRGPVLAAFSISSLVLLGLLGTIKRSGKRAKALALGTLLLLGPAFLLVPAGEVQAAGDLLVAPENINVSGDQLFYEFDITVANSEYYEQTFRLHVTGESYIFGYSWEWVVPGRETLTRTLLVMKDYYPPAGENGISVMVEITENEGIPINPIDFQAYAGVHMYSSADIYFQGKLNSKDHMRVTPADWDESITVETRTGERPGTAVLLTQDRRTRNWEILDEKHLPAKETHAEVSFNVDGSDLKKGQLYRVELYRSEEETMPTQKIDLVFEKDEERIERVPMPEKPAERSSPGFEFLGVLACVGIGALLNRKKEPGSRP